MTGSTILAGPIFFPQRTSGIQYGPRLIDSAPPASATSTSPDWIACVADTIACTPVPQSRLTVNAGVSFGMPAFIPTTRAMYMSAGSVWMTLPNTTWSIWSGSRPARSMAALAAVAPRSVGGTCLSDFSYEPIAVRAAEEMTTLVTAESLSKPGTTERNTRRWYVRAYEHHHRPA